MSKTYLITLTPTGKFFFGGDMTFSVGLKETNKKSEKLTKEEREELDFNTQFSSYIIRSNKFPQQTSLLGMLRFLILRNNPAIFDAKEQKILDIAKQIPNGKDESPAETLIGKTSFYMGKIDGYGKIKKIHPCFLQKDGVPIRFLERDYKYQIQFDEHVGNVNKRETSIDIPEIKGYSAKDGIASLYLIDGVEVPESDIFIEDWRMGINRDIKTGRVDDNSLYKQVCYRFNDKLYEYEQPLYVKNREHKKDDAGNELNTPCKYTFAFYAEMDLTPEEEKNCKNQLVSVGGDNSQFVLDIKAQDIQDDKANGTTVILVSPAYLTKEDLKDVRFAITETIPFKCMQTTTKDVEAYNRLSHRYDYLEGLNLYDRGSVFYFKTETEAKDFTKVLEFTHDDFYQIGYNHYRVK